MTAPEPGPPVSGLPQETINRNWTELVQELRSTQTGVQVLTGFLLAVPFTDKFDALDNVEKTAYLVVLSGAVGATMAVLAPIAYHRILFRRGRRPWLVETANKIARAGLVLAALTMCGVVFLAFDLTISRGAGIAASLIALLAYVLLWVVVPLRAHPPEPAPRLR
jgi:hypothetical protein